VVTRSQGRALFAALGLGVAPGLCAAVSLGGCNAIAGIHEGILDPCAGEDAGCGGEGGKGGNSSAAAESAMAEDSGGSSTGDGAPGVCGNGIIEAGEECDDRNGFPNDGCTGCVVDCAGLGAFKDPISHHCYHHLTGLKFAFSQARLACRLSGEYLAAITSAAERDAVSPLLHKDTWIGGSDIVSEGAYVWDDGEPWEFAPWKPGEPSGDVDHHDCIKLTGAQVAFDDDDCSQKHTFLCERSPIGQSR
jgi:cysteine-rich repeat protein